MGSMLHRYQVRRTTWIRKPLVNNVGRNDVLASEVIEVFDLPNNQRPEDLEVYRPAGAGCMQSGPEYAVFVTFGDVLIPSTPGEDLASFQPSYTHHVYMYLGELCPVCTGTGFVNLLEACVTCPYCEGTKLLKNVDGSKLAQYGARILAPELSGRVYLDELARLIREDYPGVLPRQ